MMKKTDLTKIYKIGLLGSHIHFSLSPKIFTHPKIQAIFPNNFALINLNSEMEWKNFWENRAAHFDYLCVTTPWKRKVYELSLQNISPEVAHSKTANWICLQDTKYSALNTDYFAFQLWWNNLPTLPENIYYMGYGASSFTFLSMLKNEFDKNPNYKPKLYIVTRDVAAKTISGCYDILKAEVINYSMFYEQKINHQTLLVNGSFYGQKEAFPIKLTKMFEQALIWDLNYALPYSYVSFYQKTGFEFLVHQALCFLTSQNILKPDQFPIYQKELIASIQGKEAP